MLLLWAWDYGRMGVEPRDLRRSHAAGSRSRQRAARCRACLGRAPTSPKRWPTPRSPRTSAGPELIDDDGRTLWQSPTAGAPLSLHYAPPEARMFLVVRPRAILATPEGPRVLQAMGPDVAQAREQFESQTGIPLEGIERLTLAYIPLDVGPPRVACVVELAEGVSLPAPAQSAGESVPGGLRLSLGGRSGFLPAARPRVLVWGDPVDVAAVISAGGSPPLLRRELDRLAQASDCERHLTLLLTPNFLAADGRDVLSGTAAKLREPILGLLGDGVQAVSLSLHLSDSFYGELRFVSTLDRVPLELAADCQERLRHVPEQVNDYLGMVPIDAFWQKLAVRLPLMVNYLFQQTRIGVSDDCAVMNFMLPTHAAHNLCLASELAMAAQVMPAAQPADGLRPSVADPSAHPEPSHGVGGPAAVAGFRTARPGVAGERRDPRCPLRDSHPGSGSAAGRDYAQPADPRPEAAGRHRRRDPDGDRFAGQPGASQCAERCDAETGMGGRQLPVERGPRRTDHHPCRCRPAWRHAARPICQAGDGASRKAAAHAVNWSAGTDRSISTAYGRPERQEPVVQPFVVLCTTCKARLKVRDPQAVGQILPCPKCGSMVWVTLDAARVAADEPPPAGAPTGAVGAAAGPAAPPAEWSATEAFEHLDQLLDPQVPAAPAADVAVAAAENGEGRTRSADC